jgi:hypothetical protein
LYFHRKIPIPAKESNEGVLPLSEARMSSGNMNFKPALGYLTQDTGYFIGPVYTAQERNESSYGSVHPASNMFGQDSSKLNAKQSQSQPHLHTANYSNDGQGNVHKAVENFHPKVATPHKTSNRNDPDKQTNLLKLPQESYSGPDSYHTITPAPSKSPPLPPLGTYKLETPKEDHQTPNAHNQPQKPTESFTRHGDQYQIPSSTEFYKPNMINLRPVDPNEPYKGHLEVYEFQPPKQTYEPQTGAYQYANMKESMKQPQHTQKPPRPKEYLTPPSDTYQLTESENSFTTPSKILQPPKSKDSFKPPTITYHDIKPEDSLTPAAGMHKHTEVEDLLKQYMDVHKPPKPQDILTPPVDMYEHPKLKDFSKPQKDRPQPQKQNYVFQGAMESYRPLPAKEIHKPLVLSPEEFYKHPTKLQMPAKDDNKMPSSSETVQELSHLSPLTHANNQSEYTDDDIYLDYDPSTYVQKENSNGHAHNNSHEYDYSEQLHGTEQLYSHEYDHITEHLHDPENDHSNKYPSHDYSGFYLHPPPPPPNYSNADLPHPPKEQPPRDKLETPPPPAKETNGSLSPPPSEPHEAPPPSSRKPYGAPPPLHIGPYGAPMYLPEQTHAAPIHPPNYVYGIHAFEYPYGVPPPPTTTTPPPPPPPPPKSNHVGYYHIDRKLYLIPAVFSFLFIPYVLALIIRSIIRHNVNKTFKSRETARKIDLDENEMERRVARALEAVEKRYK